LILKQKPIFELPHIYKCMYENRLRFLDNKHKVEHTTILTLVS